MVTQQAGHRSSARSYGNGQPKCVFYRIARRELPLYDRAGNWSTEPVDPDGQSLLYSVSSPASEYKPALWIANAAGDSIGENRRSLGLNTWADKCAFRDE